MDEQKLLSVIIQNTYSTADLNRRISLAREYLEGLLFSGNTANPADFAKKRTLTPEETLSFAQWDKDLISGFTPDNVYARFDGLKEEAKKLPVITVYLPFNPDSGEAAKIGIWLRKTLADPRIVMDIKTKTELLGGCAYVWKGVYHEFSLHHFVKKNKEEIKEVLEEYERKD